MKWLPHSLRWRTLLVLVAALVLSQAASIWMWRVFVTEPRHVAGVGQFVSHLKTVSAALQTMTPSQQDAFVAQLVQMEGIRIARARGNETLQSAGEVSPLPLVRQRVREIFGPEADVYTNRAGRGARGEELWIRLPGNNGDFWVTFPRRRIERDPTAALVAWGALGLAIAIAGTFFLVFRLNRPLGLLARAAGELGKGGNPAPVPETGPSEIRAVARAFNDMKEDLQKSQRERATFLAGVSHDLRTPLARLRLEVEMLEGKVELESQRGMVQDLDDMNAIIDQFIDFMRSEAAEPPAPVALAELARSCAERAMRSGVEVACELEDVPPMMLRPLAMQRLIDNLLGNAARHAGGEVRVVTRRSGDETVLAVLDRGPGIPRELVERLKQPFTRRDAARSGSSGAGLGLAIAERVARLHGGRLDLLERGGGGLEARVTLPLRA